MVRRFRVITMVINYFHIFGQNTNKFSFAFLWLIKEGFMLSGVSDNDKPCGLSYSLHEFAAHGFTLLYMILQVIFHPDIFID